MTVAALNGKVSTMMTTAQILVPLPENTLTFDVRDDLAGYDAGGRGAPATGPSAAMHDAPNARISAAEYELWLLPPEPRDAMERTVHALSQAAGVLALTGAAALLWLIV